MVESPGLDLDPFGSKRGIFQVMEAAIIISKLHHSM